MFNYPINPIILNESEPFGITFRQTRDTLLDTEEYYRFIRNAQLRFRKSRFYKGYKAEVMQRGNNRCQRRPGITSDVADIEMHHNVISLEMMSIMIVEHYLNLYGSITTFDLIHELKRQHSLHRVAVFMMTETEHEAHHGNPSDFISIRQCWAPNLFDFIFEFSDGLLPDIAYKILLHLKLEEQYGGSHDTNSIIARNTILQWAHINKINL